MRAVEQRHLALVVRFFRWNEQYVQAGLVCGELLGNFFRSFYYPKVECLSLYYEIVAVAYLLLYLGYFLARESRYDSVDERGIYAATVVKPLLELLRQFP